MSRARERAIGKPPIEVAMRKALRRRPEAFQPQPMAPRTYTEAEIVAAAVASATFAAFRRRLPRYSSATCRRLWRRHRKPQGGHDVKS